MADPNLNIARGLLDGFNAGLDGLDRLDARKRQQQLDLKNDMLFRQSQSDRETRLARESRQTGQNNKLFDQSQEDRAHNIERRGVLEAQEDALMPLQLQAQKLQLSTAETQQRIAQQQAKNQEVTAIWNEASTLFDGGEYGRAETAMAKLADYGYDVEGMSTGAAQEATDIADRFVSGEIEYGSPELKKLASWVLTPSLVQSGRDPERFSVGGIVPSGRTDENGQMTFMVTLDDKQAGEPRPATLNRTNAGEEGSDTDPVIEVSASDLMAATQQFIKASTAATQTRMRAIGASLAGKALERQTLSEKESLELDKTRAEIEKIKAETAKVQGSTEGAGTEDALKTLFMSNFTESPRLTAVAEFMMAQPDFDYATASEQMVGLRAMDSNKDYAELGPGYFLELFNKKEGIKRDLKSIAGEKITNFLAQYPGLKESDKEYVSDRITKFVTQSKDGAVNAIQLEQSIKDLHKSMSRKVPPSPGEATRDQSTKSLEAIERQRVLDELPDPAEIRGYR